MFLLRCIFWLTIVFNTMSWSDGNTGAGRLDETLANTVRTSLTGAVLGAGAKAAASCNAIPEDCLSDAAKLSRLILAQATEDAAPAERSGIDTLRDADRQARKPIRRH